MNSKSNSIKKMAEKISRMKKRITELELDLTSTKEAFNESQQRFMNIFEDPAMGMIIFSPEGDFVRVNDYVCRMLGYTEEELKRKNYADITHPDDMDISMMAERKILSGELLFDTLEKRYFDKNGDAVWVFMSFSMIRDKKNAPLYYVSHIHNVTERKIAEAELQASERRFTVFMNNLPGAAWIQDSDGHYVYANKFFVQRVKRIHPEGLLGFTDDDIYPQEYAAQYNANSRQALSKGKAMTFVETAPEPDTEQEVHWLSCRFPLPLEGNLKLLGGMCLDVSARIRAERKLLLIEKELKEKAERLEQLNMALNVLLEHREQEKEQQERLMLTNLEKLVIPYLRKIEAKRLGAKKQTLLEIALSNLEQITSPLVNRLMSMENVLTPTELEVSDLIRHGRTTDEISDIMNISTTTVAFHRRNIRIKLGLKNKKINLMSHLRALA